MALTNAFHPALHGILDYLLSWIHPVSFVEEESAELYAQLTCLRSVASGGGCPTSGRHVLSP